MSKEVLKEIKGFDGYKISSYGRVFSEISNRFLALVPKNNGYLSIGIYRDKKCKKELIHRLVANAFVENIHNKPDVNHKDGNKENNHVSNLEWVTKSENSKHSYMNNFHRPPIMIGENHPLFGTKGRLNGVKGKNHPRHGIPGASAKVVLNTETGIFYDTIRHAAASKGIDRNILSEKLNGKKLNNTPFILA